MTQFDAGAGLSGMKGTIRAVSLVVFVWLVAAFAVAPFLLRRLPGEQSLVAVDQALGSWRLLALRATVLAVGFGLLLIAASPFRRTVAAWSRRVVASFPAGGLAGVLLMSSFVGCTAGLAEAWIAIFRRYALDLPTGEFTSLEVFWLAPLVASATFTAVGLIVAGMDRLTGARGAVAGLLPALFISAAVYSALRRLSIGIHSAAIAVLAVGVAVQVTRMMVRHRSRTRRFIPVSLALIAVLTFVWAVALPLGRQWRQARTIASLPSSVLNSPNVLLIVWDAVRAASLSAYGHDLETTPDLERLAGEGVLFERAIAPSPWSLPTHASLFTGLYPNRLNVDWQTPLDDREPTLAEVLAARGYATAGFVANRYYAGSAVGLSRGFATYHDRMDINVATALGTWWLSGALVDKALGGFVSYFNRETTDKGRSARDVLDDFLRWRDQFADRSWFAFINVFDAHNPYVAPAPWDRAFSDRPILQSIPAGYVHQPHHLEELRISYESCIRYLDAELGRVIDALKRDGSLDRTIVIVTSDHGEQFGEHGLDLVEHGRSLYLPVVHVPLVIRYPPLGSGVLRSEFVSLTDVPATILDLLSLGEESRLPGRSFFASDSSGSLSSPIVFSTVQRHLLADDWPGWPASAGAMHSAFADDFQFIRDARGEEYLFNVDVDYWEQNNLVGDSGLVPVVDRLRSAVRTFRMTASSGPGSPDDPS